MDARILSSKGVCGIRLGAKTKRCSRVGYHRMLKQTSPSKERNVCLVQGRSQTMQQSVVKDAQTKLRKEECARSMVKRGDYA